jgi:hypothetical protein
VSIGGHLPGLAGLIVGRNTMRTVCIAATCFVAVLAAASVGCTSTHKPHHRPAVALQLQKSLVLSGGRYAQILRAIEMGHLKDIKS